MNIDPVALHTELVTDPSSLGYPTPLSKGNAGTYISLLNQIRAGAPYTFYRKNVSNTDIIQCVTAADMANLTALQIAKLTFLFQSALDLSVANTRQILSGVFGGASSDTLQAIIAIAKRQGSRAEVLWGEGVVIVPEDIWNALQVH